MRRRPPNGEAVVFAARERAIIDVLHWPESPSNLERRIERLSKAMLTGVSATESAACKRTLEKLVRNVQSTDD